MPPHHANDPDGPRAGHSPSSAPGTNAPAPGRWQWTTIALAAAIGCAASLGMYSATAGWQARVAELRFAALASDNMRTVNMGLSDATGALWSLRAYFESRHGEVAKEEYQAFSASLRQRAPGLRDTGWAPRVLAADRDGFETAVRNQGTVGFQIKERGPDGTFRRAADRPEYFPVLFSDPGDVSRVIAGFDLASEPVRRAAVARARATGEPAATPPVRLVTTERPNSGFMGFVAVRAREAEPGRDPQTRGVVLGAFETERMIGTVLSERLGLANLDLCILDPAAPPESRLIYWHAASGRPPPTEQALLQGRHWQGTLELIDQRWSAIFVPSEAYDDGDPRWTAAAVLACGLLITAAVTFYLGAALRRTRQLERLAANLRETTGELVRNSFKLDHMARHDALTGLANRLRFRDDVAALLRRAPEGDRPLAVLYLDLDRFKAVNDTLGHPVGDRLLQAVAKRLTACVRDGDTVARLGGDEFAIAQSPARLDCNQPFAVEALSRRLVETIGQPYDIGGHAVSIGVSVGFALAAPGIADVDQLLRLSDMALYVAKREGRGTFRGFDPSMEAAATAQQGLEAELREALERGELVVYFQPQVATATGRLCGFEALLRWHHPDRGLVMPGDFMRCAEESGLAIQIGAAVLRQSLAAAALWPPDVQVSVNLSPGQLARDDFVETVAASLADAGQPGTRLVLEMTEAAVARHYTRARDALPHLRALGVQFALDNCGTGSAALDHLHALPIDRLKIDHSLVAAMMESTQGETAVRAILQAASVLGIAATAEGVETAEQLDLLAAYGCTAAQGFLFSPARTAAALAELLERSFPAANPPVAHLEASQPATG
jgi:diguanylate cyclase (GGDEF)-like protein